MFALAKRGFSADKEDALDKVAAASPKRTRIDIDANHNAPMTQPHTLAEVILERVPQHTR